MEGKLSDELGDMLGGEELSARLACVGSIVGDKELISIAKEVYLVLLKTTEVKALDSLDHRCQAFVLFLDGIAQAVGSGVKVGKEAFDISLRRVAVGGAFYSIKDSF